MKTIRISEDFFNKEKTKSVGGCYFEATMDDLSYCNMQINIRELDCLTEEIKEKIKENFNDFIDSIFEYGWKDLLGENEIFNIEVENNIEDATSTKNNNIEDNSDIKDSVKLEQESNVNIEDNYTEENL